MVTLSGRSATRRLVKLPVEKTLMPDAFKYRRVLLKLSGEALMGDGEYGIDLATVERISADV